MRNRLSIIVLLALVLAACNMPGQSRPTEAGPGYIYTAAAQTVQAQIPQTQTSVPGFTQVVQTPVEPTASNTAPATTQAPQVTQTPGTTPSPQIACDAAKFDRDITYPDNTDVAPGATFVKTWRLQNVGSCTWTTAYSLVFSGGDAMGAQASMPLPNAVAPGDKVDLSVSLTAPNSPGRYRGEFKLRNANNGVFGLGESNKPFWVQVDVVAATGLVYDFIAKASSADWVSGTGDNPGSALAFGGADDDPNGAAKIVDDAKLETGATSGKVLLTIPKQGDNGYVQGTYSEYTVQPGDHFTVRLGFIIPSGSCEGGKVTFQLRYKEGDNLKTLKEWTKACNGKFLVVDEDLTGLRGKTVRFVLIVRAAGSAAGDWAIWNSAAIEH